MNRHSVFENVQVIGNEQNRMKSTVDFIGREQVNMRIAINFGIRELDRK